MNKQPLPTSAENEEIVTLLRTLHETEQRLQELTRGRTDAAGHLAGQSHLLGEAQKKLLQSEERFRHLEENISDVLWIRSPDLKELHYVSPAFERIWGRSVESFKANPHQWSEFIVPEDRPRVLEAFAGLMNSAPELDIEYRISRPDASIRWVNVRGFRVRDQAGNVIRLAGIVTDITERRQAREQLKLLETCVAHLTDVVIIMEADPIDEPGPCIVFVNDAFVTRTGYSREETLGQSPRFLEGAKTRRDELDRIRDAMQRREPVQAEIIIYTSNGGEFWLDLKIVPVAGTTDGHVTHFVAVGRDITERRRAEEELSRSNLQVREQAALLDAASDAIILKDMNDRILFWSRGAEQIYGWTAAEAIGKVSHKLLFTDPVRFAEAQQALLQKKHWRGEIEKYTKDRRPIMVEARWTVVPDKNGQPKSILDINTDITERKRLEAQFLRVQRMESIGTLASGVAHDLNNMLTPITMSIQLLQQKVKDREGRLLLETLDGSAQRGADLVKQVLSFARGVEGRSIPINPLHVIRDIQKIIGDTFPKNVNFSFVPVRDVWTVIGDPTQLHQVFLNLCVNARDAMPLGGKLTVTMENTTLDGECVRLHPDARPGTYVLIQVSDTGTGIPPAIRDRIFEPFFTTKEIGKGTGLGLSTTQAIVKSHAGFINVCSELGKGSTFKVYLPAKTTEEDTERAIVEKNRLPSGHGELVLVVDDEEGICLAASRTLERFGYRVLLAANGAEAVVLYARRGHEIAIVLTDMAMPVMDGPSTIMALKVMNPKVKIIGSSGHASNHSMSKVVNAGLKYFIPKPYSAEALLKILAEALQDKAECPPDTNL